MLPELYQLSQLVELDPLGYGHATIHWSLDLYSHNITPLYQTLSATKKGQACKQKFGKPVLVPEMRRNAACALLIDDSAEYLFGAGERGKQRQTMYLELLDRFLLDVEVAEVKSLRQYLANIAIEDIIVQIQTSSISVSDQKDWEKHRFIILYQGKQLTRFADIEKWWSNYYQATQDTTKGTCTISGIEGYLAGSKLPVLVKGVPGSQPSGAALSSFDKGAYQSYGWDGNYNAPISFAIAAQTHSLLNQLLRDPLHHYQQGKLCFVFWGYEDDGTFGINPDFWNHDPAAAVAQGLLSTPTSPKQMPGTRGFRHQFYLASLKGNVGRVAIISMEQQDIQEIKQNVQAFLNCQLYHSNIKAAPIWCLLHAAFRDPKNEHTDKIFQALIMHAILGHKLPEDYALRLLRRIPIDLIEQPSLQVPFQGLSLFVQGKDPMNETEKLAYQLGRAAFMMHAIQIKAQNRANEDSTNVLRSLKTFSTFPATVFPRLYQGALIHLSESQSLEWMNKLLTAELVTITEPIEIPNNFNTREQSYFYLGWAKKRSEFFQKKEDKSENTAQV